MPRSWRTAKVVAESGGRQDGGWPEGDQKIQRRGWPGSMRITRVMVSNKLKTVHCGRVRCTCSNEFSVSDPTWQKTVEWMRVRAPPSFGRTRRGRVSWETDVGMAIAPRLVHVDAKKIKGKEKKEKGRNEQNSKNRRTVCREEGAQFKGDTNGIILKRGCQKEENWRGAGVEKVRCWEGQKSD